MPAPIIPILSLVSTLGGIVALIWYSKLSRKAQAEANRIALQMFGRMLKDLGEAQAMRIMAEMKSRKQLKNNDADLR